MNQDKSTDHANIRWQWFRVLAASAVLPTHVYLFNVLDVIRAEGDNDMLAACTSVAASFTDLAVVNIVSDNSSAFVNVASTVVLIILIFSVHSLSFVSSASTANLLFH